MSQDEAKPEEAQPSDTIRTALAAMKSCVQCGEPWTPTMQEAYDNAKTATDSLVEEGWRNCVGYLSDGPCKHRYVAGVPERTGADALWKEFTHARQLGLTGKEPDTRVQMLDRFAPKESAVILEVRRMIQGPQDMVDAHSVVRLVVQALLYGPDAALKDVAQRHPTYAPWTGETWPEPPGYTAVWEANDEDGRRLIWTMRYRAGSMAVDGDPTDAELRRYVGEVMAGGPGFSGAK